MSSGRDVIITGTCYLSLLIFILRGWKINSAPGCGRRATPRHAGGSAVRLLRRRT